MTYSPTTWINGAGGATPLDATNLNNIESGVSNNDSAITTLQGQRVAVAGLSMPLATKTANYNLASNDGVILANGTITLTLPAAASAGVGKIYAIRNIHASATATVNTGGGNIDGTSSKTIAAGARAWYVSDGSNWWSLV